MSGRQIEIVIDITDRTKGKVEDLKKSLNALDKQAQRLNNRFKSFSSQKFFSVMRLIDQVTTPASRINNLLKKLSTTTWKISMKLADGALASVRKIESSILKIANKVYPIKFAVQGGLNGVGNKLSGLFSGAALGAGVMPLAGAAGIGFGVTNAISAAASFEKQMSRVQALQQLDKNSDEMKLLTQQARDLGMSTAFTRKQVGEAQEFMALAGWNTKQILKATPHMLNLAAAGGMDLGAASDLATDAMTAFNLKATDVYRNKQGKQFDLPNYFVDMLAKLQASSNTDLYQAREAIKYGAPAIGSLFAGVEGQEGVQLRTEAARQMMIMVGLQANAGIKGSMAGTGINTIFNRLAGQNRNTYFAEKLLGLEHEKNGEMLMPLDFIRGFQRKIKEGMNVDEFMQVAEELAGERINADTRRKLSSTIDSALKNGGRLGSADIMKISGMLAGLEAMPKLLAMVFQDIDALEAKMNNVEGTAKDMAETQLDNLAGSFTKLESAWDAFQQDLFTGTAGDSLRGLVDTMTEILTRANKLFQDGIDIGDFGQIIADVVDKLKNKFMQLDGVGSLLAGGALVAGLMKIISLSQRAFTALKTVTQAGAWSTVGKTGTGGAGLGAGAKVGTMTVSAGVVHVNGKVAGGAGGAGGYYGGGGRGGVPGMGVAAPTTAAAVFAAQKQFDKLNSQFIAAQAKRDAKWGRVENLFAMGAGDKQLARARTLARNFDEKTFLPAQARYTAARQALINARVADYQAQIAASKQSIAFAREQEKLMSASRWSNVRGTAAGGALLAGVFGALDFSNLKAMNAERLAAAAPEERAQILKENKRAEFEAGAGIAGSMIGTVIGASLGSFAGPVGTAIGSVVGGVLGDYLGRIFGKDHADNATNKTVEDMTKKSDAPSWASFRAAEDASRNYYLNNQNIPEAAKGTSWEKIQLGSSARRRQLDRDERWALKTEKFHADQEAAMRRNGITKVTETMDKIFGKSFLPSVTAAQEYYRAQSQDMGAAQVKPITALSEMLSNIFSIGKRAEAAELTPEQMAQQTAMERGEFYPSGEIKSPSEMKTPGETPEVPNMSAMTEQFYSEMEALQEGVGELFSGFGEQITEQLTSAFEGAGEVFTNFGKTITEGLTATFEGAGELFANFGTTITEGLTATFEGAGEVFANFGTTITEGLTATFEGAGEMFTGFGEQLTASMTTAQESATTALTAIQTSFMTTKDAVQTSWAELPAFFSGVFNGLGGAAEAAGSAIYSGLTSIIGSIIGAWQSAASTISGIISSIASMAASAGSAVGGIVSSVIPGHAEGGFITSPEVALIGEKGAEVVIPLNGSQRALDLYKQTGEVLGISDEFGDSTNGVATRGNGGGVSVVNNINFEISATDGNDIVQKIREHAQEISDIMAASLSEAVATVHKNQTLCA